MVKFWPPLTPNTLSKLIFYLLINLNVSLIYMFYTKVYPQIKKLLKKGQGWVKYKHLRKLY